ncbi:MAG: HAD family hydrolase [Deltaproteobacteria bacterium HGW-Deltaproteobacteria-24]|jgi:phosphoglycolate phosphatase|nr:MAG: HAD family hydrolase [Deltaproteobacteria bacterium HGW-Deltaproteobacteria-24]
MKPKGIIFDLDGTLLDSLEEIALSMNEVLKEFNLPTHPLSSYNQFVGDGALYLIQRAVPKKSSSKLIESILTRYLEVYEQSLCDTTQPYEGIYELLNALNTLPLQLGILSNKPHKFTCKYAQTLFGEFNFSQVHGQKEDVPKKPHPQGALNIANAFNLDPQEILFVGDTPTDIHTAHNANMKSIGVLWGFRTKEELQEAQAHYLVQHPLEILEIIKN